MQWRELDGYDWCLIETPQTGPYLSLTLGYGLIHEPLEHFGTLQTAAGMLQTELSRPVETGFGRASVPEVSVDVGSDTTYLGMRGDIATLSATWNRLAKIFAGSQPLDAAPPVDASISVAPRDISSRFGITALTLAASEVLQVEAQHNPSTLLRYLDPAAGNVGAVMCTNTERLMRGVFARPVSKPQPERSRYLPTARPGGMQFRAGYALVSTVVPRDANGEVAVRVLAQQLVQHLTAVTRRELGLSVSFTQVGPDMLATLMTQDAIIYGDQRSQVHELLVSKPIPDHRIAEAVDWANEYRSLNQTLALRAHGLEEQPVRLEATEHALAQARATMRFFTDPLSEIPSGYGPVAPELPSPDGQRFKSKAGRDHLVVGTEVIERRHTGSRGVAAEYDRVDATSLVLVIDDPKDCAVLIDDQYRTVEIIFDTHRKQRRLRELIAQRTAGVPRITAANAALPEPARRRIRSTRAALLGAFLIPALIIGFAVFMSWLDDFRSVGEPAPEHANPPEAVTEEPQREPSKVETTAVGQTATLANWSRVTVGEVREVEPGQDSAYPADMGQHYAVAVEYCAAEEEDSVHPEYFRLLFNDPAQLAHPFDEVEDPLEATDLSLGQCAIGNVGFYVAAEDPTDLLVDYRPGDSGGLSWSVEDADENRS